MAALSVGIQIVYGFLFVAILIVKYFKDREINRSALLMWVLGMASLVVGGFLAAMVGMGSAKGAMIIGVLFGTAAGVLLVIGLFQEFLGGIPGAAGAASARPPAPKPPAPESGGETPPTT